jgi:hypothetical protein
LKPPSFYYEIRTESDMIARQYWSREWWDDHDPDKLVAHYMELDKTYPPERFFRPDEVGCVPRTFLPEETLDLEQRILTQLHLLSPEQQSSVLGFVERLQGQ